MRDALLRLILRMASQLLRKSSARLFTPLARLHTLSARLRTLMVLGSRLVAAASVQVKLKLVRGKF